MKVASTDAVRLIKEAGGTAILAHPLLYGLSNTNLQKMIDELKPAGLDGLEAIYSTYTTGEEQQMKRLARENGLLISGGSDFHGSICGKQNQFLVQTNRISLLAEDGDICIFLTLF